MHLIKNGTDYYLEMEIHLIYTSQLKSYFKGREGFQVIKEMNLPEFKLEEKYFILKDGKLTKLKRKEIKKLGLEKIIKG